MSAGAAIFGRLSETTSITNLVGAEICPKFSPTGIYPRIVFDVDEEESTETHDGPTGLVMATVSVSSMARNKEDAVALSKLVAGVLKGKGTWGNVVVQHCFYINYDEEELVPSDTGENGIIVSIKHTFGLWYEQ